MNRPTNPSASMQMQKEPSSIIELVGGPSAQGLSDQEFFMAEMQLYSELNKQKILEKEDRSKIEQYKKNAIKGLILANVIAGLFNRLLTKIKYKRIDFMNLHFIFRLPIRLSMFAILNLNVVSYQLFALQELREGLNKKYMPRYQDYMRTGGHPMSILNKNYMNDPDITQEEKDVCNKFPKMNPAMKGDFKM